MATHVIPKEPQKPRAVERPKEADWTKPQAMAIPKEGYFKVEQGRYGPVYPRTPACYGFSVIGKVKPGREQAMRDYGKNVEEAVKADPFVLGPLKLHYLRWVLFDVGSGLHFMYQGIFDTDFDKYVEDAIELFNLGHSRRLPTGIMDKTMPRMKRIHWAAHYISRNKMQTSGIDQ